MRDRKRLGSWHRYSSFLSFLHRREGPLLVGKIGIKAKRNYLIPRAIMALAYTTSVGHFCHQLLLNSGIKAFHTGVLWTLKRIWEFHENFRLIYHSPCVLTFQLFTPAINLLVHLI